MEEAENTGFPIQDRRKISQIERGLNPRHHKYPTPSMTFSLTDESVNFMQTRRGDGKYNTVKYSKSTVQ